MPSPSSSAPSKSSHRAWSASAATSHNRFIMTGLSPAAAGRSGAVRAGGTSRGRSRVTQRAAVRAARSRVRAGGTSQGRSRATQRAAVPSGACAGSLARNSRAREAPRGPRVAFGRRVGRALLSRTAALSRAIRAPRRRLRTRVATANDAKTPPASLGEGCIRVSVLTPLFMHFDQFRAGARVEHACKRVLSRRKSNLLRFQTTKPSPLV